MYRKCLVIIAVLALAACSSGGGSAAQSSGTTSARRGGQNLITAEEIASSGGLENALDAVQRLRPSMMRPRTTTFQSGNQAAGVPVLVYSDEVKLGGIENLRSIPISQVREIRYLSATDATQRWGTGHSSGVIQVVIKR